MTCNEQAGSRLEIEEKWTARMRSAGLDTFDSLMGATNGRLMKSHLGRSETYLLELTDGQPIYVKRSLSTRWLEIVKDALHWRPLQPGTHKEAAAFRHFADLGIVTPRIIAEGQRRRGSLPWQGVLVSLPLPGLPLAGFIGAQPADKVSQAMRDIVVALTRIAQAGLCWPDLHVRHVHLLDDGRIGFLDLERVHSHNLLWCPIHRRRNIRRFVEQLLNTGLQTECLHVLIGCLRSTGYPLDVVESRRSPTI